MSEQEFLTTSNLNGLCVLINALTKKESLNIPSFKPDENRLLTNTNKNPYIFFWDYNSSANTIQCNFSLGNDYARDIWDHRIKFYCRFSIDKRLDLIARDLVNKVIVPGYAYFKETILPRHDERMANTRQRMDRLNRFNEMLRAKNNIDEDTTRLSAHLNKIHVSELYMGETNDLKLRGLTDDQTAYILQYLGFDDE